MNDDEIERRVTVARKTGVFTVGALVNTEAALARLAAFTELRCVDIRWCPGLRDEHLRHLTLLPRLRQLRITMGIHLTNAGLSVLDRLDGLHELSLIHCDGVGNETVERAIRHSNLETLRLVGARRVFAATLARVGELGCLRTLDLSSSPNADANVLGRIATLPQLEQLRLANCKRIDDSGLSHLGQAQRLVNLDLMNCARITDAGLSHVAACPRLTRLTVTGCHQVGDEGVVSAAAIPTLELLAALHCPRVTEAVTHRVLLETKGRLRVAISQPRGQDCDPR